VLAGGVLLVGGRARLARGGRLVGGRSARGGDLVGGRRQRHVGDVGRARRRRVRGRGQLFVRDQGRRGRVGRCGALGHIGRRVGVKQRAADARRLGPLRRGRRRCLLQVGDVGTATAAGGLVAHLGPAGRILARREQELGRRLGERIDLVGPLGRAEGLVLEFFHLALIGAVGALQFEVLANCVVKNAHRGVPWEGSKD